VRVRTTAMVGVAALGGTVKREAEEDWGAPPGAVDNMPGSPTNHLNLSAACALPQSGTVVI